MKPPLRSLLVIAAALAALVATPAASARPASTSFGVVGYEYAFTQTVGSFAGTGHGNAGDSAAWNTRVVHDPLGSTPTYVNGGSFAIATHGSNGHLDFATGTFVHHGGMITVINPGAGCTNQQFRVTGALRNVTTSTTTGGSGRFVATLTHFRTSLLGHCVIYAARVSGMVSFSY